MALLSGEAAWACTPAAASNVTATCTGTTTNQGGGAPGTSLGFYGYGTGTETGVTVNVGTNASVIGSGTLTGIFLGDATVTNNAGGSITGIDFGIKTATGSAIVTNSGSIENILTSASIFAQTNATVINNAGAKIVGFSGGIQTATGFANVTNSGVINGINDAGIIAQTNTTVTNNAGAIIEGGFGIRTATGFANVTNSGNIFGIGNIAISAQTNATVTNNAGALIGGTLYGILANAGGSSVFNAGTISGSTAAIRFAGSGNTLTLGPGSVISGNVLGTGNDTFQLGGTGTATFDVSTLGPQYQGFATFNKIGGSVWTLTGTSSYAGPVNVNGGTLDVNGNVTSASAVTVSAGGTLGGNGTVGNTTINAGGTFAPGNGTPNSSINVTTSLSFQAGSIFMVQVNPATASFANVTGTATLGGATVNANFAPGSYVSKQYTIVQATGLVSGTFNPTVVNTNLSSNLTTALSYDAHDAYLNLTLNFTPGPLAPNFGSGLNRNQQNVGNALTNFFNSTGGIPLVFSSLTPAGLSQASGETATGSQQTTFNAMTQFMGIMTDPFIDGRGDGITAGSGATPFAEEIDAANAYAAKHPARSQSELDAYAAIYRKAAPMAPFTPSWSVWASGFGGSQTTNGDPTLGSNSTTSRLGAVAVGADYRFSPSTIAGFALAGGGTSFSVANGGTGRSDLFQAGAFVRHTVGPAYFTAALAYGWQDITTDRTVTIAGIDQLHAHFNANAFSGRIEDGYRFVLPWMAVTPYAAAQFTTFDLPAYAEQAIVGSNNFALAYGAKSVTDTRSEVGLRTDKSWAMPDSIFTLRGRLAWAHDYDTDRSIGATFQTLPGASFVVNGAAQSPDKALTTASAEVKWRSGFSLAATFEGEFSNNSSSYAGKGVARYQW